MLYISNIDYAIVVTISIACEDCAFIRHANVNNVIFWLKNVNGMMKWRILITPIVFRIPLLIASTQLKFRAGQEFSGLKVSRELLNHILIRNTHNYLPTILKGLTSQQLRSFSSVVFVLEWRWMNENVTISREDDVKLQRYETLLNQRNIINGNKRQGDARHNWYDKIIPCPVVKAISGARSDNTETVVSLLVGG